MIKTISILILTGLLSGCLSSSPSEPKPRGFLQIGTGSTIDILTPYQNFMNGNIPAGWVVDGINPPLAKHITRVRRDGALALNIKNTDRNYLLARYSKANLLVSPYLMWDWYITHSKEDIHPVSLLIGFYGGKAGSPRLPPSSFIWRGHGLPAHDRLLAIGYAQSALKRGNLYKIDGLDYYIQRGGIEQSNRWHLETVDLSELYKKVWPQDNPGNALVSFVAFKAKPYQNAPAPQEDVMSFASVRLSR